MDKNLAYFMNWDGKACSYNLMSKNWNELQACPYTHGSLAIISDQLTAIGGCINMFKEGTYTNKLLSLPGYKKFFPPMPTKRQDTTAVTSKEHLIVADGAAKE